MTTYAISVEDKLTKYTIEGTNGCLEWTATRNKKGYGIAQYKGKSWLAHRLVYTELVGEIPEGLTLDHLCQNTCCVNLLHLEVVTRSENALRGHQARQPASHCRKGHERVPENVYRDGHCKTCKNEKRRKTPTEGSNK